MEVADQRVAAPARPDFREGDGAEHPDSDVFAVGMVEAEPGGRDGERASRRDTLLVQRIARRPAPGGTFGLAVAVTTDIGGDQLGGQ